MSARGFEIVFGHEISGFFGLFIFIPVRIPKPAEGLETVGVGFGTDKGDGLHHGDPIFGEQRIKAVAANARFHSDRSRSVCERPIIRRAPLEMLHSGGHKDFVLFRVGIALDFHGDDPGAFQGRFDNMLIEDADEFVV